MNNPNALVTKDEAQLFQVRFDGFEGLPTRKANDNFVDSPEFTCFGHGDIYVSIPVGITDQIMDCRISLSHVR